MKVTIHVTIGELVLRNSELEVLEVTQELGEHSRCRIEFIRDSALDVNLDDLLRDPVVVTVKESGGQVEEIFVGAIVDGTQSHLLNLGSRFTLEAVSGSERLDYQAMRYFQKSKLSDVAGRLGVKIRGKLRRPEKPFNLVQWGETEFAFLKRLADEHGGFLYTAGREVEIRTEFLADRQWDLLWGDTLLAVTARARPVDNTFNGAFYSVDDKHAHRHAGVQKAPDTLGGASQLWNAVTKLARTAGGGGDPGLELSPGRATTVKEYKSLLQSESERALGNAVLVEGMAVKPGMMVGDLVLLTQGTNFSLPTTGKLGLVKVVHLFSDQHFRTTFTATPWATYTNPVRPPAPAVPGVAVAVVIENEDPKKLGRIKVRYPWQDDGATGWARVAVLHAGNDRGFVFLPEIGDEVLVAFDEGDPERPIVIGSLYNGKDVPPANDKGNTEKWIRTQSGNTIHFSDQAGKEVVEIHTPDGKCHVQLSNGGKSVVTVKCDGDIALEAGGELRFKAAKMVQEIDGDSVKKVGGDESFDVKGKFIAKAGMDVGLSAGVAAVLSGGATAEVAGKATAYLMGGMVQIQPPGYPGKQVMAKPVSFTKADLGTKDSPKDAEPSLTADPATPRR